MSPDPSLPKRLVRNSDDDEYILQSNDHYITEASLYSKTELSWYVSYESLIKRGFHPPYPDVLVRQSDGQRFAKNTYWTYCTEEGYEEKGPHQRYTYDELIAMGCVEHKETPEEIFKDTEVRIGQILENLEKETGLKVYGVQLSKVRNALGSTISIECKITKEKDIPTQLPSPK